MDRHNWVDKSSSWRWIRKIDWKSSDSVSTSTFLFFWRPHPSPGDNCAALYHCVQEFVAKSTRLQVHQNRFRSESAKGALPAPPSHNDPGKWALVGLKWCRLTIEAPTVSWNVSDDLAALIVLRWTAGMRGGGKKNESSTGLKIILFSSDEPRQNKTLKPEHISPQTKPLWFQQCGLRYQLFNLFLLTWNPWIFIAAALRTTLMFSLLYSWFTMLSLQA